MRFVLISLIKINDVITFFASNEVIYITIGFKILVRTNFCRAYIITPTINCWICYLGSAIIKLSI